MITCLLIGFGAALCALSLILLGAYIHEAIEDARDWLADHARGLRAPAPVYIPASVPDYPRYEPPAVTPPEGTEVRQSLSRADLPVTPVQTVDHAPTGPFARVPYAPEPPSWAKPIPTTEDVLRQYDSWKEAQYGTAPVLAVDEAQRQADTVRPLGLADLGPADRDGRTLAERIVS